MARRNAFTLIEVMIVLTIVVSFMAIAWPRMRGLAGKTQLREAAVGFKAVCAEARDQAVRYGRPTMVRYRLGESQYRLSDAMAKHTDSDDLINVDATNTTEQRSLDNDPLASDYELPLMIQFAEPTAGRGDENLDRMDPLTDLSESGEDDKLDIGPADGEAKPFDWIESESITFYPEGRSSSATVRMLASDSGESITLTVRGLTGGVSIGPVETAFRSDTEPAEVDVLPNSVSTGPTDVQN